MVLDQCLPTTSFKMREGGEIYLASSYLNACLLESASHLSVCRDPLEGLLKQADLGWGLRIFMLNKFLDDVEAAHLGTHCENLWPRQRNPPGQLIQWTHDSSNASGMSGPATASRSWIDGVFVLKFWNFLCFPGWVRLAPGGITGASSTVGLSIPSYSKDPLWMAGPFSFFVQHLAHSQG